MHRKERNSRSIQVSSPYFSDIFNCCDCDCDCSIEEFENMKTAHVLYGTPYDKIICEDCLEKREIREVFL